MAATSRAGSASPPEVDSRLVNTTAVNGRLQDPPRVLYGWKLHTSVFGLSLALVFSALESTIISTALTTIGTSFNDFEKVGWVVTAYLVTYSSFLLTFAKLSDIFGQRNCLLFALLWFALFSGLCGGSENMSLTHLIVFRALQGIGGSGIYSIVFITIVDICPARLIGAYSAIISSAFAISNILGPIIGGAICNTGDWKWIFLLNVPGAAVSAVIVLLALPGGDGETGQLRRLDVVGAFLSVASAVLLLYGLQTGGSEHPWGNAQIIGTIVAGGVGIVLFFGWEYKVERRDTPTSQMEPMFPLRLLANAKVTLLLLSAFFQGCVFYASVINTPQLNQIVHLSSATMAGVRTLPILLPMAFVTFLAGFTLSKTLRFGWLMLSVGSAITVLGIGLYIELPFSTSILARNYGYETLLGVGMGITMPIFLILGRVEVQDRDNAVVLGAINLMRTMGGCIALSGVQAILHSQLPKRLAKFLPQTAIEGMLAAPTTAMKALGAEQAKQVRHEYANVYKLGFIMVTALGGVACVVSTIPLLLVSIRKSVEPEKRIDAAAQEDEVGL